MADGGGGVSYMSAHNRLRDVLGSATLQSCVNCEAAAQSWAYIHDSPQERVDKLGRRYSNELSDYQPMCWSCHAKYDKSTITHCPQGHAYEGPNLLMDAGKRKCRTCVYARNRKRKPTPVQQARRIEQQRARRARAKGQAA